MFEENDFESLMERMLAKVSDDFDKREGSVIYDALAPAALELAEFYITLDRMMNEVFAESASYYFLVKRAAEKGLLPREETCAIGKMIVIPADTEVHVGDRFNLDSLNYTVTSVIDGDAGEYQVECETPGRIGNQQLGELLPIETEKELNDLEMARLVEILIPGEEEENVEAFRERYFASFASEGFGGNKADYKEKVNEIVGVGDCKIIRAWKKGYRPSDMIPNSTVAAWFESQSEETLGAEVYHWLETTYRAAVQKLLTVGGTVKVVAISSEFKSPSSTLIHKIQDSLDPAETAGEGDGIAPIGHVVNVTGVSSVKVDIEAKITYKEDYSFSVLKESIEQAIDAYFLELCCSWADEKYLTVRVSEIESRILRLNGVADVSDVKLNGENKNLILDEESIPVRGDVIG